MYVPSNCVRKCTDWVNFDQMLCFWTLSIVLFLFKHVSKTGFYLCLKVRPTQLAQIDRPSLHLRTSSIDLAQLSRSYLKTETKSSFRNVFK
jgi:hypothetical protein